MAANPTPEFDRVASTRLPLGQLTRGELAPAQLTPAQLTPARLAGADFDFLYRLWLAKRGDKLAPSRAAFDPAELRAILPRLLMIDVVQDPLDFRYRLAGTMTYDLHGQELTGKSITALRPPEFVATLWADLRELVETAQPQLVLLDFTNQDGYHRVYHVLRLPLSSDGKTIDIILVLVDYGLERG